MNSYRLWAAADADIAAIIGQSVERWGLARAERNVLDLHTALEKLAAFSDMGKSAQSLRAGYACFVHERHSIFDQKRSDGTFIVRVLHARQTPDRYL